MKLTKKKTVQTTATAVTIAPKVTVKDLTQKVATRRLKEKTYKDPERCFSDQTLEFITKKFPSSVNVSATKVGVSVTNMGKLIFNQACAEMPYNFLERIIMFPYPQKCV